MRIDARRRRPQGSKGQRMPDGAPRPEMGAANLRVQALPISQIKLNPHNCKTHSGRQIRQLANSMVAFGFTNPLLVTQDGTLIAGEGRYRAAQLLGLAKVPAIVLVGLSPARQRALAIADNKIAENAGWNRERLAIEIPELAGLLEPEGLDVSILGFEAVEIDQLVTDFEANAADPDDGIDPKWLKDGVVSKPGDLWVLGPHRLLCGDARSAADIARLMAHCRADMAFLDPPYNVRIGGVVGRGKTKHSEFAMASGEMSPADYERFLGMTLDAAASVSRDGALHYVCTDWRHIAELMAAGKPVYGDAINIAVWVKSNAGQGLVLPQPARVYRRLSRRAGATSQQCRARAAWAFALERVALRRSELVPCRPHGGASLAPVRQAGRPGGRRHQGLHAPRRCCSRHLLRLRQHDHGRRACRTPCPGAGNRASVCRRRHPPLAGVYPPGRTPR
jgi:ParB-like nuclease domain